MSVLVKRPYFSLKLAAILNWTNLLVHLVLGFVITPIVLNVLGSESFGVWAVILSLSGYYGLANLGLGSALGRFVTRDVERNDLESLQETVDATTVFFVATGSVIMTAVWFLGEHIAGWLNIVDVSPMVFWQVLMVAAVGIVVDFFATLSNSILAAAERYDLSSVLTLGRRLLQAGLSIAVLMLRPGLLELSLAITGSTVVSQLIVQTIARKLIPGLKLFPRGVYRKRLAELLGYGSGTMMISISNLVRLRLGNIFVSRFAGALAVTNYTIATNLITNFNSVISSSTAVLGVRFTKLEVSNEVGKLHQTFRTSLFATSLMAFGIGSMLFVFADRFILIWLGREMDETVSILKVLIVAYVIALSQGPGWNMLFALSKHHALAKVTMAESIVNILLGLFLSRTYGALGFAWSTAITMSASKIFFQPWYAAKSAKLAYGKFFEPMLFPAVFGTTLTLLAVFLDVEDWLRAGTVFRFFLCALAFGSIYAMAVLCFCRNKEYLPVFIAKYLRRLKIIA